MRVLLAIDGSEYSDFAVQEFIKRPLPADSVVRVLSIVELPFVPTTETWALPESYYAELEKAGREKASAAVEKAMQRLREIGGVAPKVETEIIDGHAEDQILRQAHDWNADLIVVGSHGYRGWKRFLLGSVAQYVATHANCSVEIIRHRQTEK